MDAIAVLNNTVALREWMEVPYRVDYLYKQAAPLTKTVAKVLKHLPSSDRGYVFWHPDDRALWAVLGDGDDESVHQRWHNALKAVKGVSSVRTESEVHPPDQDEWVMIKRASALGLVNKPFQWGGALTGGPSPLTNTLVGGLLTGGLGYGTGWLLEHLFPERFVERGRLRKSLGLLGAGLGAAPGIWQGFNAQTGVGTKPEGWKGWITPTNKLRPDPNMAVKAMTDAYTSGPRGASYLDDGRVKANWDALRESLKGYPDPPERFVRAAEGLIKEAQGLFNQSAGGVGLRPVPMDAFNRAIWNDVRMGMTAARNPFGTKSPWGDNSQQMHTPPPLGAATAGLVSGINSMYGNQSVLSPRHFIRGLATAGVDLATAKIVGGTLGALGGLTPAAQQKIQDIGLWGGLLRGTVGSMFR